MISVIIPVLNEAATVRTVIDFVRAAPQVAEIIVVDDGSIDGTPELARAAGAQVITSTLLGKGASMRDGLRAARYDWLVYLDGDLVGLHADSIARLTAPLLSDTADLVKASFTRNAGRVTTLTARPLLQTFFPELTHIQQPLSGIVAARRALLERLRFEDDYGVDVGLLLDAAQLKARIVQADIGHVEHDSQPLEVLGDMATQVMRVILERAARYGRLRAEQLREVQEVERQMHAQLPLILQKVAHAERLALFDMDGVLLAGRFIVALAERTHKTSALRYYLDHPKFSAKSRTQFIAALFCGVQREEFIAAARTVPLMPGAVETVVELRRRGYRVGIVTDSYFVAAEIVRRRVFADFSIAHLMRFRGNKATGELTLSQAMLPHPQGCHEHQLCKLNVLRHLAERATFDEQLVIAVGDSENDLCLLRAAPLSFAFQPKHETIAAGARQVINGKLSDILAFVAEPTAADPLEEPRLAIAKVL